MTGQTVPMHRAPHPSRRILTLLGAIALVVAGCSTSGGDGEAESSTTTPTKGSTTTTAGGDKTTTTGGDDPADGPTRDELEAILPAADDIGSGWTEDTSPDDNENTSFEDQCPEVADLDLDDNNDSDKVERKFKDGEERQLEVALNPSAEALDQDQLEEFVDTINGCGAITDTDDQGVTTTFDLEAETDSDYGEQGIRLQADVTVSGGDLPKDFTLTLYALLWREGTVGVQLTALDGIDESTLETVPFDTDVLTDVADDVDAQVKDLVG